MRKVFIILLLAAISKVNAQTTNDVLNLLVSNKSITQEQADSIRADAAIKQQETDANKKSFLVTCCPADSNYRVIPRSRYQALDEAKKEGRV